MAGLHEDQKKKQEHFAQKQNFQIDNDVLAVGKIKAPKTKTKLISNADHSVR